MAALDQPPRVGLNITWQNAPTHPVNVGGVTFAYRRLGPDAGVTLVFLHHFTAQREAASADP
jgi:hypothetical protein